MGKGKGWHGESERHRQAAMKGRSYIPHIKKENTKSLLPGMNTYSVGSKSAIGKKVVAFAPNRRAARKEIELVLKSMKG